MAEQHTAGEVVSMEAIRECVMHAIEPCVRAAEERHKKAILILTREVQALRKELAEWKNHHAMEEPTSTTVILEDPLTKATATKTKNNLKKARTTMKKEVLESDTSLTTNNRLQQAKEVMVPKEVFEADLLMPTDTFIPARVIPIEPFSNIDDFLEFEARLHADQRFFRQLEMDFASIPMRNDKKFVKTCWRQMLEDNVAERFSWRGTEEKKSVRKFRTTAALMNAFNRNENSHEDHFVAACKSFFQFAKNRQKQRNEYKVFKAKSKSILKTED